MKKYFIIMAATLLSLCFLSGCGGNENTGVFSLTDDEILTYKDTIAQWLSVGNWSYNPDTVVFSQTILPQKDSNYYSDIEEVASAGSLKLTSYSGDALVLACVDLQYVNGDNTATAYFYFDKDKPLWGYYEYKGRYYSLKSKNPFEIYGALSTYEDTEKRADFKNVKLRSGIENVVTAKNGIIAALRDNVVFYYDYNDKYRCTAKNDYTGYGYVPLDVTLGDSYGAVLLGEPVKVQQNENENEVCDVVIEPPAKSVGILITDPKGKPKGSMIPTTVSSFSSLTQVGDRLFLVRDKSIDEFKVVDNSLEKLSTYMLDHYASKIISADIDGNGTVEFIISDGTKIYLYEKTATFNMIWRSNSYLSSISANIYAGDLNGDNVKEIYITDSIGITARYVLTPQGFKINNGGILSGREENYTIADFNGDNKADYLITGEDMKPKLYIME